MGTLGRPRVAKRVVDCLACGKPHERSEKSIARNKHQRFFCSDACLRVAGCKPRSGSMRPCAQCGKSIYVPPGETERHRFCSRECVNKSQFKSERRTCERCGRGYDVKPSQQWRRAARFCSNTCQGDAAIKRPLDRTHNGRCARLDPNGYVLIYEPTHPKAMRGWVFEHRWIVEKRIGRVLRTDEHVHHLNGVKDDNGDENLVVMGHLDHAALSSRDYRDRVAAQLKELEEYRKRYGRLKE